MELSDSWNRNARNSLAEDGVELTPDEMDSERAKAYEIIREEMRKLGSIPPETDEEMFLFLRFNYMLGDAPNEVAGMPRVRLAEMVKRIAWRKATDAP